MIQLNINLLKSERVKNGLTQKQVASALELGETSYCKKETGKSEFSLSQLLKLKEVLKLDANAMENIFFTK